jgi:hypothetical protein
VLQKRGKKMSDPLPVLLIEGKGGDLGMGFML